MPKEERKKLLKQKLHNSKKKFFLAFFLGEIEEIYFLANQLAKGFNVYIRVQVNLASLLLPQEPQEFRVSQTSFQPCHHLCETSTSRYDRKPRFFQHFHHCVSHGARL
jgi:hypothetical protein